LIIAWLVIGADPAAAPAIWFLNAFSDRPGCVKRGLYEIDKAKTLRAEGLRR
jgi:hypothetical protein